MKSIKQSVSRLVGIAGGSGAGKSWLASRLQDVFGKESVRLSMDDFYRDRSRLSPGRRERINFDHPRAIDWELLESTLRELAEGKAVSKPLYDFKTHTRVGAEEIPGGKPLILIEGLWLFRKAAIRRWLDCKIFLDCPAEICLERRLSRDVAERGRDAEAVKKQFYGKVRPMHERHVAPQARWADLVFKHSPGPAEVGELACRLKMIIRRNQ